MKPLVSPRVATVLALLGTTVGASALVLPGAWAVGAMLAGATMAFVGGHALPQLRLAAGRPLVPLAVAGPAGALSSVLIALAAPMPDTPVRGFLVLGAATLAFLAGKALEAPAATPLPTTPAEALEVLPAGDGTPTDAAQVRAALASLPKAR